MSPEGRGPDSFVETNNFQEQSYVDQYNREAYARYAKTISNINASLAAGRKAPMPAPKVPTGMILGPPDSQGLRFAIFSPVPLGPEIDLLPDLTDVNAPRPAGNQVIGMPESDQPGWYAAGQGDTVKNGTILTGTAANGDQGRFQKYGAPVGPGWYLKLGGS